MWYLVNANNERLMGMPGKDTEDAAWEYAWALRLNLDVWHVAFVEEAQ